MDASTRLSSNQPTTDDVLNPGFLRDALDGLLSTPKTLAPKYFYDARGSHYFDLICKLDEYYPYRTEMTLLPQVAAELDEWLAPQTCVVEFGAGSLHKIRPLLEYSQKITNFIPIDISAEHLHNAGTQLAADFPQITVTPVAGDFTSVVELPDISGPRLGFFPGSTIGNFTPDDAINFLRSARQTLGDNACFLLGVDTQQDLNALHHAYNDSQGVTAEFNKNILLRMNRELGASFELNNFSHEALFNPDEQRIEMHLRSLREHCVTIGGHNIHFQRNESIHTENSYKYTQERLNNLLHKAGWTSRHWWFAPGRAFAEVLLVPLRD